MKNKQAMILSVLNEFGLEPETVGQMAIMKVGHRVFGVPFHDEDSSYFQLLSAGTQRIPDGQRKFAAMVAADVNRRVKLAKMYLADDRVMASVENHLWTPEHVELWLRMGCGALTVAHLVFEVNFAAGTAA